VCSAQPRQSGKTGTGNTHFILELGKYLCFVPWKYIYSNEPREWQIKLTIKVARIFFTISDLPAFDVDC
jgi:hypothetical protein